MGGLAASVYLYKDQPVSLFGTLVMKFSGSCVDTTSGLAQLLSIVLHEREHWDNLVLVVSALEGVTDSLIEAAHLAHLNNRRGYRRTRWTGDGQRLAGVHTAERARGRGTPAGPGCGMVRVDKRQA